MSLTKPEWTARFTLHVKARQPLFSADEISNAVEDAYRNAAGLPPEEVAAIFMTTFEPRASGRPGIWPLREHAEAAPPPAPPRKPRAG